jgi:nucleoside-diphosphate-sugar epimerase
MKVVVTGGSGRLGREVIRELLAHGYEVLSLDRLPPSEGLCPSWLADLRDIGAAYQAIEGADAVVHLGAYQKPGLASDSETFSNNICATYNVLKAAAGLSLKRAVVASSVAAYGFLYARRMPSPEYLPLDEEHPCRPQDPYGLSKRLGEEIADAFGASAGLSTASLRLAGINFDLEYATFPERWKEPAARLGGFWSYVDVRDAAVACRLALEASIVGHRVFNVAAPTSAMREPTEELVARYVPGARIRKRGLAPNWSGLDSTRAERELGFRAAHTWERYLAV